MRVHRTLLAAATLAALLASAQARAAGYAIYEQGAAVLGMAGAGTASVHDASAVFFNPAALTRLKGTQFYVGASALQPVISFAGMAPYPGYGVTEEMVRQTFYPPTVYLSHRLGDRFALGGGVNSPYGLGVEWQDPASFSGRHLATKVTLQTLNTSLNLACALNPKLSVALGADLLGAKVDLANRRLAVLPGGGGANVDVAEVKLLSGWVPGAGWNAALHFQASDALRMGAFYRSLINIHVKDADARFTQILTGDPVFDAAVAAQLPPNQHVGTVLRFPAIWSGGLAWDPAQRWTLEADFNLFEWHAFEDLPFYFSQTPQNNTKRIEDYDDSWQIRTGAEHRLDAFTYRFGYYFDKAAAPTTTVSPLLPDADRHGVSLGLGFGLGADKRWTLDVYELALFVRKRSTEGRNLDGFDGTYKSYVNVLGFGLGYRF